MCVKAKNKGFTLIELITVLSIMAIGLTLVGPLTINFIDKAQAQSEFISLKNNLKKISFNAFANATGHTLLFEGRQLIIMPLNGTEKKMTFEYLNFDKQQVLINARGYTTPEILKVNFLKRNESIHLFRLIEGTDAQVSSQ